MKKIFNFLLIITLVFYASSCGEDYLDVNKDPNNPSDATVDLVFPAGVASTASVVGGYYAILGGIWSQAYTQNNSSNQYKEYDSYNLTATSLNFQWSELYSGALNDFEFVRQQSTKDQNWTFYIMATVMQSYTYQLLADLYDQIPFNEALKGDESLTPGYTSGTIVYDSLIARIDNALAKDLTTQVNGIITSKNPGNSDFIFGGDMEKWIQFANTLKLKIYLRQINARPDIAINGIKALYASGAEFLEDDAAMTQFIDAANKSNPLFESDRRQLNTTLNLRASKTMVDYLVANQDPRVNALYTPGGTGQKGLEQGNFNASTLQVNPNNISLAIIRPTDAVYFISEAESYFLQAEAIARGIVTGDDESLYVSGIDASLRQNSMSTTILLDQNGDDLESYKTVDSLTYIDPVDPTKNGVYAYPESGGINEKLTSIITQKWIALAGTDQGVEAFLEHNRTNIPAERQSYSDDNYTLGDFAYPIEGVTAGLFPRRLIFPDTERRRNPKTPPQEPVTKKVWWDVD